MENLQEVHRLVDKYDMLDCFDSCAAFIEYDGKIPIIAIGYQLAITFNHTPLKATFECHIRQYTKSVLQSESFLQCKREVIEHILQINNLKCTSFDLFNACNSWTQSVCQKMDSKNIRDQLGPCRNLIRLDKMEDEKIRSFISKPIIAMDWYQVAFKEI